MQIQITTKSNGESVITFSETTLAEFTAWLQPMHMAGRFMAEKVEGVALPKPTRRRFVRRATVLPYKKKVQDVLNGKSVVVKSNVQMGAFRTAAGRLGLEFRNEPTTDGRILITKA